MQAAVGAVPVGAQGAQQAAQPAQPQGEWVGLTGRLGFNEATTTELGYNGLGSLASMINFSNDDLKQMCEHLMKYPHPSRAAGAIVYVSASAKQNLYAAVYWAKLQLRYGIMPEPQDLTDGALVQTKIRLEELKAFKKSEEKQDISRPPKLKRMSEWLKFWEASKTYFGSIRGAADIPLTYIFREEENVTVADIQANYPSRDAQLIRCTVLAGTHFNTDSARVWSEWKSLIQDGPGWDFVKRHESTQNGRMAVMEMKRQTEGTTGKAVRKNKAYLALQTLQFNGPRRDWSFEQYINGHIAAHNTLAEESEPIPESKKVQDFIKNIGDDRLSNAKDLVFSSPTLMEDFDGVHQMMSLVLTNKTTAIQAQQRRQGSHIKQVSTTKSGDIDTAKSYSKDEWWALSHDEREKVQAARKAAKNKKRKVKKAARKIAAAEALKRKAEAGAEEPEEEEEPTRNAGNQFGRQAHGDKGKKKQKT